MAPKLIFERLICPLLASYLRKKEKKQLVYQMHKNGR